MAKEFNPEFDVKKRIDDWLRATGRQRWDGTPHDVGGVVQPWETSNGHVNPTGPRVLKSRLIDRVDKRLPRFTGLPSEIEVPSAIQFVTPKNYYRTLEYLCGFFYEGTGPTDGFYGWPLRPYYVAERTPREWVGAWSMQLAFTHAPNENARTGAVASLATLAPHLDSEGRRAVLDALHFSFKVYTYRRSLTLGDPATLEMLRFGYHELRPIFQHADVRDAIF